MAALYPYSEAVLGGMCLSTGNGNWNDAATWSCGHMPTGGDTAIIQAGHTVSITQNHVYNGLPLHIQVYGIWYFSGGGSKISLPCGSYVEIMVGGQLLPNSNSGGHSETVRICGDTYWYYNQGAQGGYQIWPGPPLPVELISFTATALQGSVLLVWITASESNSGRFEVSRSQDMTEWAPVSTVAAQGNSMTTVHYSSFDTPGTGGLWYYRLVQVDRDGEEHDHGAISIAFHADKEGIDCTPNPVTENHLLITCKEPLTGSSTKLVNVAQRTQQQPVTIMEAERMIALDVSDLPTGVYIAQVISRQRVHHCTFVVQ